MGYDSLFDIWDPNKEKETQGKIDVAAARKCLKRVLTVGLIIESHGVDVHIKPEEIVDLNFSGNRLTITTTDAEIAFDTDAEGTFENLVIEVK